MRELKFRAWDGKNVWYFELTDWRLDGGTLYLHDFPGNINVRLDKCEIMQYTGLHDKNGKEIYEGDIVIPDHAPYCQGLLDGDPVRVEWDDSGGWYPFADNQDGMPYPNPAKSEVIGNIYENTALGRSKA